MLIYSIYRITAIKSSHSYIGVTKNGLHKRWLGHIAGWKSSRIHQTKARCILWSAFDKYSPLDDKLWQKETIYQTLDYLHALEMEDYFINLYDTLLNGYNSQKGGKLSNEEICIKKSNSQKGKKLSDIHRQRISESNKGKDYSTRPTMSDEHKEKIRISNKSKKGQPSPLRGRKQTPDHINNSKEGRKNSNNIRKTSNYKHTEEHKQHIGKIHKGKIVSDATRQKIRVANLGKVASEATRQKISASKNLTSYILVDVINNTEFLVENLFQWCKQNRYSVGAIKNTLPGGCRFGKLYNHQYYLKVA